jgi:hypothetical protein
VSATIREIVDAALTVVGEVTGPGVQQYEDDRMRADAIRAFNMMFKKYNWRQYTQWFSVTLDGTTGKITTAPFEQVKDFEDFIAVHRDKEQFPLPIAPARLNPSGASIGGTRARFWTSLPATDVDYVKKRIQILPATSIGVLNINAKIYPLVPPKVQFDWGDTFFLDKDMLVYATAFMTLSGDDLNAGAADVVRNLMEMRYRDVLASLSGHPIPVDDPFQNMFALGDFVVVPLSGPSLQLEGGGFLLLESGGHLLLENV